MLGKHSIVGNGYSTQGSVFALFEGTGISYIFQVCSVETMPGQPGVGLGSGSYTYEHSVGFGLAQPIKIV